MKHLLLSVKTAKIFEKGYKYGAKLKNPKIIGHIQRINYIQEEYNWYETINNHRYQGASWIKGSQSITNKNKSDTHAKMINELIKSNVSIDIQHIVGLEDNQTKLYSQDTDYSNWKDKILLTL